MLCMVIGDLCSLQKVKKEHIEDNFYLPMLYIKQKDCLLLKKKKKKRKGKCERLCGLVSSENFNFQSLKVFHFSISKKVPLAIESKIRK